MALGHLGQLEGYGGQRRRRPGQVVRGHGQALPERREHSPQGRRVPQAAPGRAAGGAAVLAVAVAAPRPAGLAVRLFALVVVVAVAARQTRFWSNHDLFLSNLRRKDEMPLYIAVTRRKMPELVRTYLEGGNAVHQGDGLKGGVWRLPDVGDAGACADAGAGAVEGGRRRRLAEGVGALEGAGALQGGRVRPRQRGRRALQVQRAGGERGGRLRHGQPAEEGGGGRGRRPRPRPRPHPGSGTPRGRPPVVRRRRGRLPPGRHSFAAPAAPAVDPAPPLLAVQGELRREDGALDDPVVGLLQARVRRVRRRRRLLLGQGVRDRVGGGAGVAEGGVAALRGVLEGHHAGAGAVPLEDLLPALLLRRLLVQLLLLPEQLQLQLADLLPQVGDLQPEKRS